MKKLLKIVLWSAVALVVLAVLLIATLPLWLGPVARPIANCLGPRITQTDFYLGGLSLNPYTGRLAVRDLRIGTPAGYAEPTALNLGSLVVVLDGASLAGDCLHVREVTLKDCFVSYLYGGENGIDNLTQLKMNVSGGEDKPTADAPESETADPVAAEPEAKDFKVIVDRLSVSGVRVKFQMLTIPVPPITLTDLGKKSNGLTLAELTAQVWEAILKGATKAGDGAAALGGIINTAAGQLGTALQEAGNTTGDSLKAASGSLQSAADAAGQSVKKVGEDVKRTADAVKKLFGR